MRRLVLLATLVASGCAFEPHELPPAARDAPLADAVPADAPPPDARIDAPPPVDAQPDAEPDPCPGGSTRLALGVAREGGLSGDSQYEPSCSDGLKSGAEDLYRVDVGNVSSVDLVIDVEEQDALDTLIDVTVGCVGQGAAGTCEDSGAPGAGEVLVIPFVTAGRRYVAVDSLSGQGAYTVRAFLRGVVGADATCTPDLEAARCQGGLACLEKDGELACRTAAAILDTGVNETPCTTATQFTGDGVFSGLISAAGDVDVVAVQLEAPRHLRAVVHDGTGGCSADLLAEVLTGATCDDAKVVASDDNGGLGPCPRLDDVALPAGTSWVRISLAPGAKLAGLPGYLLVLDLF